MASGVVVDNDQARRGSRGSILSGKANVDPATEPTAATIPAHHLAKLNLSTSPDYVSDFFQIANDKNYSDINKFIKILKLFLILTKHKIQQPKKDSIASIIL